MTSTCELESLLDPIAGAAAIHRAKLELARLVVKQAPASAANQLDLVERYLTGEARAAELSEARADVWAYVGSLACYCSATDSASARAVLACLEVEPSAHTRASLREQIDSVARCGVAATEIARALTAEP